MVVYLLKVSDRASWWVGAYLVSEFSGQVEERKDGWAWRCIAGVVVVVVVVVDCAMEGHGSCYFFSSRAWCADQAFAVPRRRRRGRSSQVARFPGSPRRAIFT